MTTLINGVRHEKPIVWNANLRGLHSAANFSQYAAREAQIGVNIPAMEAMTVPIGKAIAKPASISAPVKMV